MRAVALLLLLSLTGAGCFPNNARHRTYAKLTEGGLLAGGIALLAVTNTGADCDQMMARLPGETADCKSSAGFAGGIGLAMIVAGLVGFMATVSTADDKPTATTKAPTPTATAAKPQ